MTLADPIKYRDPIGAIAAGICAGLVQSFLQLIFHGFNVSACARRMIIDVAAYFIVAFLLRCFWPERIIPRWLLTVFFGSVLSVVALFGPSVIDGWYAPQRLPQPFTDYILNELDSLRSVVILLNFVTLPVLAIFHYAPEIVRATKQWHVGSEPPSILSGE